MKKPFLILLVFIPYLLIAYSAEPLDSLPLVHEGRIKPWISVAKNSYLSISGTKKLPSYYTSYSQWLIDVSCNQEKSNTTPIFQIKHPELRTRLQSEAKIVSWETLEPHIPKLYEEYQKLDDRSDKAYKSALSKLMESIFLYQSMRNTLSVFDHENWEDEVNIYKSALELEKLENAPKDIQEHNKSLLDWYTTRYFYLGESAVWFPIPPRNTNEWLSIGKALTDLSEGKEEAPELEAYIRLVKAHESQNASELKTSVKKIQSSLFKHTSVSKAKIYLETFMIKAQVLDWICIIYGCILLMGISYWYFPSKKYWLLIYAISIIALLAHAFVIGSRVYIDGRPPVTNLYSSAVFIAWVSALLGLILETFKPSGMGYAVLGALGGGALLVAYNLELTGDTMESLRAVLNSNFWLATHVIMITIGYSTTLFAGFIANIFILRKLTQNSFGEKAQGPWIKILYYLVMVSLFFSFTGTMLGGIWADQSWGRFWGWDPKENGALVIVLWNALILHAKWGGMIKGRGLASLVSLGVVTTLLSWFGVNMLGAGLHSYGFMDRALTPLLIIIACQIFISILGALPIRQSSA